MPPLPPPPQPPLNTLPLPQPPPPHGLQPPPPPGMPYLLPPMIPPAPAPALVPNLPLAMQPQQPPPQHNAATGEKLAQWAQARRDKDYVTADAIRKELRDQGVEPSNPSRLVAPAAVGPLSAASEPRLGSNELSFALAGGSVDQALHVFTAHAAALNYVHVGALWTRLAEHAEGMPEAAARLAWMAERAPTLCNLLEATRSRLGACDLKELGATASRLSKCDLSRVSPEQPGTWPTRERLGFSFLCGRQVTAT